MIRHTWFYHADGSFAGWINAGRLGDAATLDGTLFLDEHGQVVNVGMNFAVRSIEQFRWVDGKPATAHKIFPDLHLGFFERGNELVLARW